VNKNKQTVEENSHSTHLLDDGCCTVQLLLLLLTDPSDGIFSHLLRIGLWCSELVDELPQQRQSLLDMTVSNVVRRDVTDDCVISFVLESLQH